MILAEYLEIGGVVLEHLPPGESVTFEGEWISEAVTLLNGQTLTLEADEAPDLLMTVDPGENYVLSLQQKEVLKAIYETKQPFRVLETYSDAELLTERLGCTFAARPVFREVPGTGRELYTYTLRIRTRSV